MLDTGDSTDYVVPLGEDMLLSYAYSTGTETLNYHQNYGFLSVRLNADGTVLPGTASLDHADTDSSAFYKHG